MAHRPLSRLDPKKKYLQVALNGTLDDARSIINKLPISDRIIVEAGTPIIKRYGEYGIRKIHDWYAAHVSALPVVEAQDLTFANLFKVIQDSRAAVASPTSVRSKSIVTPYVVADLKTMDRGDTEVQIAVRGGASAAIALGSAPAETLNTFVAACEEHGIDAMIDMMNVPYPLSVLRSLKKVPPVIVLHRGVDEERDNKEKQLPLHEIRRIKGNYNVMIAVAGGDTVREVQRSIFNDADIVVIWKSVYQDTGDTLELVEGFLKEVK